MNIEKCNAGGCEHTIQALKQETHDEGLCWWITKPELSDKPTNNKYCPCTQDKVLIRRYERVGYQEPEKHDQLITKKCSICDIDALFRLDDDICMPCKTRTDYDAE